MCREMSEEDYQQGSIIRHEEGPLEGGRVLMPSIGEDS